MIRDKRSEFIAGYSALKFLSAMLFFAYLIITLSDNCLTLFCSDPSIMFVLAILADVLLFMFGFAVALILIASRILKKMGEQLR